MIPTIGSGGLKGSLLARYTQRMGVLVDRRLSQIALEAGRKEAEAAARSAMEASRAKTEFLASMSHELHTPLSSIIGFAEMMDEERLGPMPPAYRGYAKNIADSGRRLLSIVCDVLDMSQIESGKYTLSEAEIDVAAVLGSVFRAVQGRAAQAGLLLQMSLTQGLPPLKADAKAFKQIVGNLLDNAIKYTNPGGSIFVLAALTAEGDFSLRVVDTGIGIKESDRARILLPFERLGESTTRAQNGVGLGLTLVNALVGLHGGTLGIESKVGVGTAVTMVLPRWRLAEPAAAAPEAEAAATETAEAPAPTAAGAPPVRPPLGFARPAGHAPESA